MMKVIEKKKISYTDYVDMVKLTALAAILSKNCKPLRDLPCNKKAR